jgi:RNA polymerase sigma-70 factor, ECF subfamily
MNPLEPSASASLGAIEELYRARLPEFRRVAAVMVGDRELARDAVQEGFARAVRERATFRGDGPLEAWLWRIVINTARSEGRAQRRIAPQTEPSALSNGHTDAEAEVRAAIGLLPERQRLVLFLHYYADLDYASIAEALEIRPGTVGATLHAARASMRRLLEEVMQ